MHSALPPPDNLHVFNGVQPLADNEHLVENYHQQIMNGYSVEYCHQQDNVHVFNRVPSAYNEELFNGVLPPGTCKHVLNEVQKILSSLNYNQLPGTRQTLWCIKKKNKCHFPQ